MSRFCSGLPGVARDIARQERVVVADEDDPDASFALRSVVLGRANDPTRDRKMRATKFAIVVTAIAMSTGIPHDVPAQQRADRGRTRHTTRTVQVAQGAPPNTAYACSRQTQAVITDE